MVGDLHWSDNVNKLSHNTGRGFKLRCEFPDNFPPLYVCMPLVADAYNDSSVVLLRGNTTYLIYYEAFIMKYTYSLRYYHNRRDFLSFIGKRPFSEKVEFTFIRNGLI